MERTLSHRDELFRTALIFLMGKEGVSGKELAVAIDRSRRLVDMLRHVWK